MTRFYAFIITILCFSAAASALPAGHFARHSRLAEGRWVKVAVPACGLYRITASQLRSWGLGSPDAVRVYGYGGRRIDDRLDAASCIDDLPPVQSISTPAGIIFYGVGPDELLSSERGHLSSDSSPYTTAGYYFLTSGDTTPPRDIPEAGTAEASAPATTFTQLIHHETDRVSPGEAGPMLVGEEFRLTPRRTFDFATPDRVEGSDAWLQCGFVAVTPSAPSYIEFTVNGTELPRNDSDRIPTMSSSSYQHAMMTTATHSFTPSGDPARLKVELRHTSPSSPVYNAWLDYLSINYERRLAMPADGSPLAFSTSERALRLEGAAEGVSIWDVTDPADIRLMRTGCDGSAAVWTSDYAGLRRYVAFRNEAVMPAPELAGNVPNSDLHSHSGYDMVIFTPAEFRAASERIAGLHRAEPDTMRVAVVDIEQLYNEFASGAPDVSAMRKYLKMLHDRGPESGHGIRYALLMGRPTYDNRRLTANMQRASWPTLPCWVNRDRSSSLHDSYGFGTDDFIAMLADGSGTRMGTDDIDVAVGRICASSASEASSIVDKMEQYLHKTSLTPWKNVVVLLADDGDGGIHAQQADSLATYLEAAPGQQHIVTKIYTDTYRLVGGNYPQARSDMYRRLDEGAVWWAYIGHASNHGWTGEGMLTFTDINGLYLRNVPFIYAATCNFLRWDSSTISGGEIMHSERNGGCIGIISATRPVYITDNGYFSNAMGRAIARRDEHGRFMRAGDIYRHAKNDIRNESGQKDNNLNRLRFVFCGDPAMRLATPSNTVRIDSIDGVPFDPDSQPTLEALRRATLSGHVESPDGRRLDSFEGTATIELYDAERTIVTNGNNGGNQQPYDTHGSKLLSVSAPVSGGRFDARLALPADISDNFRPAMLNIYAATTDGAQEAIGVSKDIYVFGLDETAAPDTEAPSIDALAINHNGFRTGDIVSTRSPMVLASVSDNIGINISSAGIGHQLVLTLDSATTYSDAALYYRPHPDGTPGGTLNYPLPDLEEGLHTLRLRVWDTSGNATESNIEFFARADVAPQIFDLYCDANPARTAANFYITHDAPDAMATITVTVYNMLGNPVWTRTERGRSDMFTSTPVSWNLCDGTGRRVPRGIYVYSATITVDGTTHRTESRKLAVTAY